MAPAHGAGGLGLGVVMAQVPPGRLVLQDRSTWLLGCITQGKGERTPKSQGLNGQEAWLGCARIRLGSIPPRLIHGQRFLELGDAGTPSLEGSAIRSAPGALLPWWECHPPLAPLDLGGSPHPITMPLSPPRPALCPAGARGCRHAGARRPAAPCPEPGAAAQPRHGGAGRRGGRALGRGAAQHQQQRVPGRVAG